MPTLLETAEPHSDDDCIRLGVLPQQLLEDLPHDRRRLQQYVAGPPDALFNFGSGSTPLDLFVRNITRRQPRRYAAQWSAAAWWQAFRMYAALRQTDAQTWSIREGLLPRWLHQAVGGSAWPDDDAPAPTLFGVILANIEWFELAAAHPTELILTQQFDPAPSLGQIETAFNLVKQTGGTPYMYVSLTPGATLGSPIEAQLETLYATWHKADDETIASVAAALGGPPLGAPEWSTRFPDQLLVMWEWMGFWNTFPDAQPTLTDATTN